MSSLLSTGVVHVAGIVVISQLIASHQFASIYDHLNKNATYVLHDTVEKITDALALLPEGMGLGTLVQFLLYGAVGLYVCYLAKNVYSFFFRHTEICRFLGDVGYDMPKQMSKQEIVNEVRRRRKVGELPPVYPNGWFGLMRSDDLAVGATQSINAIGQHFALFRGEEGKVHVLDAYCPHLGANLGVGAKVVGNCVECPFHGWQYDGESGMCTNIPYSSGKIPSYAKVKVWPSLENNGYIMVWHDAEGRDPSWFPEEYEQIKSGRWTFRGSSIHYINAHIEEVPENAADISHLQHLHSAGVASGSGIDYNHLLSGKLHAHRWEASWAQLTGSESHIGRLTLKLVNSILGVEIRALDFNVTANQVGPGVVFLPFKWIFGTGVFIQTLTPQEPLLQKLSHCIYADWWMPTILTRFLLNGEVIQLERDVTVWNNKRYNMKPLLVKEDQLILKHRRWYSQFYSENSPRFSFQKDDLSF